MQPHGVPHWPQASLLGRLPDADRDGLLRLGTKRTYQPGESLVRQGDEGDHAVLLISGAVKVTADSDAGGTALLGVRFGGDLIGEMAALEVEPRSTTVTACTCTLARTIASRDFTGFLHSRGTVAVEVVRMVSKRLRWANQRRIDVTTHDAPTRVARVLFDIVQTYGQFERGRWRLGVPLNHEELGSLAGVRLRTVEKALRDLEEDGVVTRHYRRVEVLDTNTLREVAKLVP